MAKQNDLVIDDLRGGMNNSDPPHILPNNQCVLAENVEFVRSTLGERRRGMETVDITSSGFDLETVIVHIGNHLPELATMEETEAFGVAATDGASATIAYRQAGSASWTPITPDDAIDPDFPDTLRIQSQTLHGKWFVAYKSAQDRMHLWDGTDLRRMGLATVTGAPTAADSGGAGTFAIDDRAYRVRFIVMSGSEILLRSEPSGELAFTPSGVNAAVTVTKPASVPNEGETHWELEAFDGTDWYIIATTAIATATADDTNLLLTDYAINGELSADIGDYEVAPSAKYVKADQDRLILAGSWTEAEKGSRIMWTPVWNDPGVGNDERIPLDTDNYIDLDWMEGGELTGISDPLNGAFYAFKWNRIYKLQRTGQIDKAYQSFLLSKYRGAIPGTIVNAVDEFGQGCVYFLDPSIGPCRVGSGGIRSVQNLGATWRHVNTTATNTIAHGVYYPDSQQVIWWMAVDGANTPNYVIKLHVEHMQSDGEDGTNGGWTVATGTITEAWCSGIIPETVIDSETGATYLSFRPYLGFESPHFLQRADVGDTDNGDTYRAVIRTKPYLVAGLLNKWGGMCASLLAEPNDDPFVLMNVKLIRDFGKETNTIMTDFVPETTEELVIKPFDNLRMSNAVSIQVEFSDI
jgi:hypothetical protein